jgi:N-methylhydantoinase B/oxoprolinase/acetone carboxylase alpha subunit
VHTHITNTRIGDVELLERRYPVIVHRFGLREGTGGAGRWRGGEGCVRELEILEGMQVSILSEVRALLQSLAPVLTRGCRGGHGSRTAWRAADLAGWAGTHG